MHISPERGGIRDTLEKGYRRGLLLPDLEGVDTVDEQISIAKKKAGIDEDEENVKMYRFEVIRHE